MAEPDARKEINKLKLVAKKRPDQAVAWEMQRYFQTIVLLRRYAQLENVGVPAAGIKLSIEQEKQRRAILMQMLVYKDLK